MCKLHYKPEEHIQHDVITIGLAASVIFVIF